MRNFLLVTLLLLSTVGVFAQTPPLVFSGKVLLPDESPAAGAKVWLTATGQDQPPGPAILAITTADAEGRFAFPPTPALIGEWPTHSVCARAEGYAFAWTNRMGAGDTTISLTLQKPFPLYGKVTDFAGRPVAGLQPRVSFLVCGAGFDALSFLDLGAAFDVPAELSALTVSPTDAEGRYSLSGLPPGVDVYLRFDSPACASVRVSRDWAPLMAGEPLDVILPKPGTIRGRVLGPDGKPAAGLKISTAMGWAASANTDGEGRYELANLAPGAYQVYMRELPVEFTVPAYPEVRVEEGATVEGLDFRLERGIEIAGRATDQDSGAPLAGVGICCNTAQQPAMGIAWPVVKTGPDGRYSLRAPTGKAELRPFGIPPGWRATEKAGWELRRFTLAPDEKAHQLDFTFVRSPRLTGTVVDAEDRPVPGAHVLYYSQDDYGMARNLLANERGEWGLDIRPDATGSLAAYSGEAMTVSHTVVKPGEVGPVALRLTPNVRPTLTGRALGEDGKPISYAIVRVDSTLGDAKADFRSRAFVMAFGLTDAEGRFLMRTVWPGATAKLRLRAGGYSEQEKDIPAFAPAEVRDLGDLSLPIADVVITGTVLDEKGKPVAGANLDAWRVRGQFTRRMMAVTGTDGRFRIAGLPREPVRIDADQFAFDSNSVMTEGKSQDVVLRVLRRRDQVLFTHKLDPPITAEIRGTNCTLRALYRFQAMSPAGEVVQYLALDLAAEAPPPPATGAGGPAPGGAPPPPLPPTRRSPNPTVTDDLGNVLATGPSLQMDGRYLPSVSLPTAGAKLITIVLSDVSGPGQPFAFGPLQTKELGKYPTFLWSLAWEGVSQRAPGAQPPDAAPPYLTATVYAIATSKTRYRPLAAAAGQPAVALSPVSEWAYDPAGDKLTLPDALKPREAELHREAQEALAAARKAFPTLGAGTTLQGFLFQSSGGHGELPLPAAVTVTLRPCSVPTSSEVLARDLPLPPELRQADTF